MVTSPVVLSTHQAAKVCGVSRRTMLRWAKAGLIPSHSTGGGWRRLLYDDLLRFMRARGIPDLAAPAEARDIVIADDDRQFVASLERAVSRARPGDPIHCAYDGFTAGLMVARYRPALLLVDSIMPGLAGTEVCAQLRSDGAFAATRIVVISGALTPELRERLAKLGADAVIEKPIGAAQIREILDAFLPRLPRKAALQLPKG